MADAGVSDPDDLTEKLFVDAQASSAFSLNAWSALELCVKDKMLGKDAYLIDYDPSTQVIDQFPNCKLDTDMGTYMGPCWCYHEFKSANPAHPFNRWLEKFVQYKQCGNSADGRSGLIQLGPIFSWGRAVPGYLHDVPFDHPDMIKAFARLWDDMSAVLAQAKFTIPANDITRRPEWIISIGNEVNLYLNDPTAIKRANYVDGVGSGASDSENVATAWTKYNTFYQRARNYVRGLPVDTDGNGTLDLQNTSTPQVSWVAFSTAWRTSPPCSSPGWAIAHPGECPVNFGALASYLSMLATSNFASYTYYPFPFGFAPGSSAHADSFYTAVTADLNGMKAVSEYVAPFAMGRQLPIVLQEVGYPSSWVDPNLPIDAGAYNSDNIADQQEAFVQGAIWALKDYNSDWIPEIDWWVDALFTPPPDPSQGPFVVPRIVSYNVFMLHDFYGDLAPNPCFLEKFHPDPDLDGMAPTTFGVFLCSLGVRTETGAEKDAGGNKTPWGTFVQEAMQITNPGLDPDRHCP
jgi:hypothetical protein